MESNPLVKGMQFKDKVVVITGTPHEDMIKKVVDNASYEYYNNYSDLGLALEQNKIDFFVNNDVAYKFMKEEYPDFIDIKEKVTAFDIGTIFPKGCDNKELIAQHNEYIERIKKDGTLKNLQEYWLNNNKWEKLSILKDGENGTLVLTTCTSNKPFAMMLDGDFAGCVC